MAQLHFYIPDLLAEKVKTKAEHEHLSVSKYLAELVKREVSDQWPEDYFDLFGKWEGESLERPNQGEYEKRVEFD